MKVILINGSPRKNWNTHRMLLEAEKGAIEAGAETEMFHLYDIDFRDCISCFACKVKGNATDGVCAVQDGLREVYEKIRDADGLIIGSPVYYGDLTGETVSFINRLLFPVMHYEMDEKGNFVRVLRKKKKCGLIVTMNVSAEQVAAGYGKRFEKVAGSLGRNLGSCETIYACDTYQFDDYSRYYAGMWDAAHKAEHRETQFPIDLKTAYELGKRIAENGKD